jgi:hypothetical protein
MSDDNLMAEHSQNQRERLNYLEFRLYFTGQISRADLMQRFGISEAAATRDLAIYRDEAAENLEFDTGTKIYRISKSFALSYLENIDPKQLLRALVHGLEMTLARSRNHSCHANCPVGYRHPQPTFWLQSPVPSARKLSFESNTCRIAGIMVREKSFRSASWERD